jgi:hypothetical protein
MSLPVQTSTGGHGRRVPSTARLGGYLVMASAVVALAAEASDPVRWYGLTLLAAGLVVFVVAREARVYGMVDLSNPVVMSLIASVVFFGLLGGANVFPGASRRPLLPVSNGSLFRAFATVGVSMLCLWAGSRLAEPVFRVRPQPLSRLTAQVRQGRVLVVVAIGASARVLLLVTGNLGYQGFGKSGDLTGYANWLATGYNLLPFAAGLLLVDWFTTRRRASLHALVALFVVEMATSIVAGVKGLLLQLVIYLGVVAVRAGRRPSLRVAVTGAVFFVIVIAPSVEAFRAQVQQSGAPTSLMSRITAPLSLVGGSSGSALAAAKASYRNTLLEEQNLVVDIALIQSGTPSIFPYEHGQRWLLAPLAAAIPRAVWPGKPSLSNGTDLAVKYSRAAPDTTSMPATTVGDEWIQFGWLGVIGASLILGAVYRLAYTWVARRRSAAWTIALCFVVAGSVFSAGLDVASLMTSAARTFVVLGLFAAWVLRPSTHRGGVPGVLQPQRLSAA